MKNLQEFPHPAFSHHLPEREGKECIDFFSPKSCLHAQSHSFVVWLQLQREYDLRLLKRERQVELREHIPAFPTEAETPVSA